MRLDDYPLTIIGDVLGHALGWTCAAFGGALLSLAVGTWIGSRGETARPAEILHVTGGNVPAAAVAIAAVAATAVLWVVPLMSANESLGQRVRAALTIAVVWVALGGWVGHLLVAAKEAAEKA